MVEGDLERASERAEAGESKIVDLEEELRVIGEFIFILETEETNIQILFQDFVHGIRLVKGFDSQWYPLNRYLINLILKLYIVET